MTLVYKFAALRPAASRPAVANSAATLCLTTAIACWLAGVAIAMTNPLHTTEPRGAALVVAGLVFLLHGLVELASPAGRYPAAMRSRCFLSPACGSAWNGSGCEDNQQTAA
jgi:hypothetical protein